MHVWVFAIDFVQSVILSSPPPTCKLVLVLRLHACVIYAWMCAREDMCVRVCLCVSVYVSVFVFVCVSVCIST